MIATYRLQLHPDFRFDHVRRLIPYFSRLGVSHLYLSPITQARAGSTHGYDVIDHNAINEELGGYDGFMQLADACEAADLRIVLDFVPNHAGVGPRNRYWQDVLAFGPHARYAHFFDIEWTSLKPELRQKILLPFLGKTYGEVLDGGELGISYAEGYFYAQYYENRFALSPSTYATIVEVLLESYEREDVYFDLKNLAEAYSTLQPPEIEKAESLRVRLQRLLSEQQVAQALQAIGCETLHDILEQQFWRLSFWKTASSEINYRRFFDINELVALRMEDEQVFWDGHRLLGEILAHPAVEGVRIDHVDGLADPHDYLERLREVGPGRIWVEKILAPGETLPPDWPVDGTTGYEFMNDILGLMVDSSARIALDRTYRRFVGDNSSFDDIVYRSKMHVMQSTLSSELVRLSYELDRISEADYHTRDFTLEALQDALQSIVAAFDRYRTYLPHDADGAAEVIREAVYRAMSRHPHIDASVFEFIRSVILGDVRPDLAPQQQAWTRRLQQYCAPVAAKGLEDTAFYRYHRLAALNEVGGEPADFGHSLQTFHSRCRFRAYKYPFTLLATATHDHKRGEDTRMRLVALSEVPNLWQDTVQAFEIIAQDHMQEAGPASEDVYIFLQMLTALWEDSDHEELPDRLCTYMQKASRESKQHTSWTSPNSDYETALEAFIRGVMEDERTAAAITPTARTIADVGFRNTITQLVLKLMTPGVPDVYQGTELWDLSMVDPDNRRPVDFEERGRMLDAFESDVLTRDDLVNRIERRDITLKFYLLRLLLRLRGSFSMTSAGYRELSINDTGDERWVAFLREDEDEDEVLLVAVGRHFGGETAPAHLSLPEEYKSMAWTDVLTDEPIDERREITLEPDVPWVVLRGTKRSVANSM